VFWTGEIQKEAWPDQTRFRKANLAPSNLYASKMVFTGKLHHPCKKDMFHRKRVFNVFIFCNNVPRFSRSQTCKYDAWICILLTRKLRNRCLHELRIQWCTWIPYSLFYIILWPYRQMYVRCPCLCNVCKCFVTFPIENCRRRDCTYFSFKCCFELADFPERPSNTYINVRWDSPN
jgi:hypothetical protein